jgi:glycosidase
MKTTPPTRKEDVKDPIGVTGWPKEKGRDGERTPMQWDASANAGFTKGTPWLPVPPSAADHQRGGAEERSQLAVGWYQSLIRLKKTVPAFESGANIDARHGEPQSAELDAAGAGHGAGGGERQLYRRAANPRSKRHC